MCKKTTGAFSQMVGYSTAFSGVITGEFAYATYSCQFNNKKDEIMFDFSMILVAGEYSTLTEPLILQHGATIIPVARAMSSTN